MTMLDDALAAVDQAGPETPAGKAALLGLARQGVSAPAFLIRLEQAVAGPLAANAVDVELLLTYAQQAWIADQRNPAADRARKAAEKLTRLVPALAEGHRQLGLACLTQRDYIAAAAAFAAVKAITKSPQLDNFKALAENLLAGRTRVSFDLAGARYEFDLSTHNAAAIESSAFHSVGALTEWEELQYLGALLPRGHVRAIAEVGVLMGNHTAYFLRTFRPETLILVDADPANIPLIERTVAANASLPAPRVEVHCAYAAGRDGDHMFAGAPVPKRALAGLISGPVDFIKIDVDGGEIALLKGAEPLFEASKPAVMIETTPRTHEAVAAFFTARGYTARRVFDRGDYRNMVLTP